MSPTLPDTTAWPLARARAALAAVGVSDISVTVIGPRLGASEAAEAEGDCFVVRQRASADGRVELVVARPTRDIAWS